MKKKELHQGVFKDVWPEINFACVDYDGTLRYGRAIDPRYTYNSERWHGFTEAKEFRVENSEFEPLTKLYKH